MSTLRFSSAYSPTGSILSKSDRGTYAYAGASPTSAQLANPQAVTEVTDTQGVVQHFEYDANGNLIRDGRYVHEWDYMNRLVKTTDTQTGTVVENSYLGMKRVTKTVIRSGAAPETTLFIGDHYEALPNGDTRTNIYADLGGSQPLHVATVENKSGTETINYIHSDHLGSSGLVTDERGDIIELTSYYPFGEVRHDITNGTFDERHEFTGYEKDDETGLNYANARYYDSEIGKFLSQDPMQWRVNDVSKVLSDPQALNFYTYSRNSPMVVTDPSGEFWWKEFYTDWDGYDVTCFCRDNGLILKAGEVLGGRSIAIQTIKRNQSNIESASNQTGVSQELIKAVIYEEQSHQFPPLGTEMIIESIAPSLSSGGIGVMQVTRKTAESVGGSADNLLESKSNIRTGAKILLQNSYSGIRGIKATASRYNSGEVVSQHGARYGDRVKSYVQNDTYVSNFDRITSPARRLLSQLAKRVKNVIGGGKKRN